MIKKIKQNKGIALLFTIMLSSILLVIALSIVDIATKESIFTTSARNTNNAFFSADTGIECALYQDQKANIFNKDAEDVNFDCLNNNTVNIQYILSSNIKTWTFDLINMGSSGNSCAKVEIEKTLNDQLNAFTNAKITARGYSSGSGVNECSPNDYSTERELQAIYTPSS